MGDFSHNRSSYEPPPGQSIPPSSGHQEGFLTTASTPLATTRHRISDNHTAERASGAGTVTPMVSSMTGNRTSSLKIDEVMERLTAQLQSEDGTHRQRARNDIIKIGRPAVPFLIQLLSSPSERLRWEACKALGRIVDPASSAPLVEALRDNSMEIRWLAAEDLIALGEDAIVPLLQALEIHFNSVFLLEGAHHVLHAFEKRKLLKKKTLAVLDSLRYLTPKIEVAVAAAQALESLVGRRR